MTSATPISIGLRVYNGEPTLGRAIDSLLGQTHKNFELIIADNASTDETEAICRKYARKDKRIKYIRHTKNIGPTKNFEYVLRAAKYDYFMWASHDDIWDQRFIQKLLPVIKKNSDLALVAGECQYILPDGKKLPFFSEGRAFYDGKLKGSPVDEVKYVVTNGYGNLIYGIYRRKYLFLDAKQKRTVLHNMRAEVLNELPFYINLVLNNGKIQVQPEVLMYKETIADTYYVASLESDAKLSAQELKKLGRKSGFSPRVYRQNLRTWRSSMSYHQDAIRDCVSIIDTSGLDQVKKERARRDVRRIIWRHYYKVVYWAVIWQIRPLSW